MNPSAISLMARSVALMALEGDDHESIERSIAPHLRPLVAHELAELAVELDDLADLIRPASHTDANGHLRLLPTV